MLQSVREISNLHVRIWVLGFDHKNVPAVLQRGKSISTAHRVTNDCYIMAPRGKVVKSINLQRPKMLVISQLWIITIPNLVWQMHISVFKFVSVAKSMHQLIVPTLLNPNSLKKKNMWMTSEAYPLRAHTNWYYPWGSRGWHTILESTCPGGANWHNFNLPYCLSTCPVIKTIYTIYCAIIKNVKIHRYIFWFSLQKYFTNKFCLPQGQVTFRS